MKKLRDVMIRSRSISTSVAIIFTTASAIAFWFATAPRASAADCTLCHKKTLTITVVCGSPDHQRHVGHGDTVGACSASP